MKAQIEQFIIEGNLEEAVKQIKAYETVNPKDMDLYSYYVNLELLQDHPQKATEYAREAYRKNPFFIENNYNLATCYECCEDVVHAYVYYRLTKQLQEIQQQTVVDENELQKIIARLEGVLKESGRENVIGKVNQQLQFSTDNMYRYKTDFIGKMFQVFLKDVYYLGFADDAGVSLYGSTENLDLWSRRSEIYAGLQLGQEYKNESDAPCILPAVANPDLDQRKENNVAVLGQEAYELFQHKKYSRIMLEPGEKIVFYHPVIMGKAIPLKQPPKSKKLVLNIFVDSLNASVLEEYGLEQVMPNTARYFSDGAMFTNYYAGSEYTLPSVATYWTGKLPSHHMYLSEDMKWDFLRDEKAYVSYFKEAGYVTAKIGENDSVTTTQGYAKDFDRIVFGVQMGGRDVKTVVNDVMEHMETFHDTNQFIWMEIQDLHDIAGNFPRGLYTETKIPIKRWIVDNDSISTVKQSYSENKKYIYVQELKRIDFFLENLYHYLETHYQTKDVVVSLISDHGTAFNVADGEHFMSIDRERVPFLLKGSSVSGKCDEIIQTTDYAGMMCKCAGIDYRYEETDAILPACLGGEKEREYAFSQCLFPNDPYLASVHTKTESIYFTSKEKVKPNFMLDSDELEGYVKNRNKEIITEQVDTGQYENYVKKQIGHLITYGKE
ncbi:MAG: sulfatase-like hydrolase/transferase [Eubacterium sp.]|nr:sulfatase-like hydrolase/transferase [Eubacterium sp.]